MDEDILTPFGKFEAWSYLNAKLDRIERNQEVIMDNQNAQTPFIEAIADLSSKIDQQLAKETKDEADLADANALIVTLKDQLSHAGMTDAQEAEVLATLATLEAKLAAVTPAPVVTPDPVVVTPDPTPVPVPDPVVEPTPVVPDPPISA